jgi:recombination protein RecT
MTEKNYEIIKRYAKSEEIQQVFQGIVGQDKANGYIYSVIVAVSQNQQLQTCTPQSIMRSAARAATLGLSVDPAIGQAYLVPYKGEATLQPGWRGLRDMAYRTGKVAFLNVGVVAEGQTWVQDQMTGVAKIEGYPTSNKPIGYFSYMKTFTGREHFEYMTIQEIESHRDKYAQGADRAMSAWKTNFDRMARKTVLKRLLSQWAELDPTGSEVMRLEESIESVDNLPDPSIVTVIEPERRDNKLIMAELGFEQGLEELEAEFTVIEPDEVEPEPEPAPKPQAKPQAKPVAGRKGKTSEPGSAPEMYSWVSQGAMPYIGVKDARDMLKECNGDISYAWERLAILSSERAEKDQPGLL